MTKIIDTPDGPVEFPDEMQDDQIAAALSQHYGPPAEPPSRTQELLGDVGHYAKEAAGAVVEPLLKMGSGMIAKPIADVAGLASIPLHAAGLIDKQPQEIQQAIQSGGTYEPRTEAGASGLNPLNAIPNAMGKAVEAIRPSESTDPASIHGALQNAVREAIPQALSIAGVKYGPALSGHVNTVLGKAAQELAGLTTGAGGESFKLAYLAGKNKDPVFVSNLRGEVPVEQVLTEAKAGLHAMQDDMMNAYKGAKIGWAADKTPLSFAPIDNAFRKLSATLQEKGHSIVGTAERAKVDEVKDVLNEWRKDPSMHTTLGLDALKRRIDAIYPDNYSQKQAQRIITGTRNAVKDAIVKQQPEYATAMKEYENQLGVIRDIEQSFSLGGKASKDTAIRKLQSLMRNNVSTNYGMRQGAADVLEGEGGVSLRPALAGQSLSSITPRGLARVPSGTAALAGYSHPAALAALPFTSPRLMGETFYGAGRAAPALGGLQDILTQINSAQLPSAENP